MYLVGKTGFSPVDKPLITSPLILNAVLHVDLINVVYLTACIFIMHSLNDDESTIITSS